MLLFLSDDALNAIAGFLAPRQYVRFLSTCRHVWMQLSHGRAAVVYPLALEHMRQLIYNKRATTEDAKFMFEKMMVREGLSILVFNRRLRCGGAFKAYYQLHVDKDITIIVNRRYCALASLNDPRLSCPIGYSRAVIKPSKEQPFASGSIELVGYIDNERMDMVRQYHRTVEYTDGFDSILHELACNMCPLKQSFRRLYLH